MSSGAFGMVENSRGRVASSLLADGDIALLQRLAGSRLELRVGADVLEEFLAGCR